MRNRPGGYLGGTTAQFIELGERLAELERQEFDSKCLDLAKAMQAAVVAALPVVEAAAALVKSGGDDGFESCEFATLHIALEVAVEAWREAQTGAQG